jgi:hypothetical protein
MCPWRQLNVANCCTRALPHTQVELIAVEEEVWEVEEFRSEFLDVG